MAGVIIFIQIFQISWLNKYYFFLFTLIFILYFVLHEQKKNPQTNLKNDLDLVWARKHFIANLNTFPELDDELPSQYCSLGVRWELQKERRSEGRWELMFCNSGTTSIFSPTNPKAKQRLQRLQRFRGSSTNSSAPESGFGENGCVLALSLMSHVKIKATAEQVPTTGPFPDQGRLEPRPPPLDVRPVKTLHNTGSHPGSCRRGFRPNLRGVKPKDNDATRALLSLRHPAPLNISQCGGPALLHPSNLNLSLGWFDFSVLLLQPEILRLGPAILFQPVHSEHWFIHLKAIFSPDSEPHLLPEKSQMSFELPEGSCLPWFICLAFPGPHTFMQLVPLLTQICGDSNAECGLIKVFFFKSCLKNFPSPF